MSRSSQLLPPQPPLPRSLWPTDTPLPAAPDPEAEARTQPRIALPWAASGPLEGGAALPVRRAGAQRPLAPLDAAALPYRLESHMSLAVALDVLATQVHQVRGEEAILSLFTDALLTVRHARSDGDGLTGEEALEAGAQLRRTALGPVGEARAALARPLAACAQVLGEVPSAAEGVALACAQVILGAREVVLRARLALEAKQAQEAQSRPGAR